MRVILIQCCGAESFHVFFWLGPNFPKTKAFQAMTRKFGAKSRTHRDSKCPELQPQKDRLPQHWPQRGLMVYGTLNFLPTHFIDTFDGDFLYRNGRNRLQETIRIWIRNILIHYGNNYKLGLTSGDLHHVYVAAGGDNFLMNQSRNLAETSLQLVKETQLLHFNKIKIVKTKINFQLPNKKRALKKFDATGTWRPSRLMKYRM